MKLIDAPVGVLKFNDTLILKTEYMKLIDDVWIPQCYILETGEEFWGGMKTKDDFKTKFNSLKVQAITVVPGSTYDQVRWERNEALKQLEKLGYGLGECVCSDCQEFDCNCCKYFNKKKD